jgi:hypothetical protein
MRIDSLRYADVLMGRMFFLGGIPDPVHGKGDDKWAATEEKAMELQGAEGGFAGHEKAPVKRIKYRKQDLEFKQDVSIGLDGQDVHMGGERVSKLKEERLEGGDIAVYWQNADSGGTYVNVWNKTADGRHRNSGVLRRIRSF